MSNQEIIPSELPVIPLKNVVLFPRVAIPLLVQRPKSVNSLDQAMEIDRLALFVAQKNIFDDVDHKDLFLVGTVGKIFEVHHLPDGSSKIDVEGIARVYITNFSQIEPFFRATIKPMPSELDKSVETEALIRATIDQFKQLLEVRNMPALLPDLMNILNQIKDPFQIVYLISINLNLELQDKQEELETNDAMEELKKMNFFIGRELEIIDAEKRVVRETRKSLGKMQKEMFLREQMKSIEKELGMDGEKSDIDAIRAKIKEVGMSQEAEAKALKELARFEKMPPFSPEISYLRTYLDWLTDLPWSKKTGVAIEMGEAEKILDADHYGLKKAKERILE